MILTFSKKHFVTSIIEGVKVHTIKDDKHNRWEVGAKIHFWYGKSYQFGIGEVSRVEPIKMHFFNYQDWQDDVVYIGNDIKLKNEAELNALAVNEGLRDWQEMRTWFENSDGYYFGKIIFWKNFRLVNSKLC